jgi:hypothetical protein
LPHTTHASRTHSRMTSTVSTSSCLHTLLGACAWHALERGRATHLRECVTSVVSRCRSELDILHAGGSAGGSCPMDERHAARWRRASQRSMGLRVRLRGTEVCDYSTQRLHGGRVFPSHHCRIASPVHMDAIRIFAETHGRGSLGLGQLTERRDGRQVSNTPASTRGRSHTVRAERS